MERTPPLGPFPGSGFLSITHSPRKAANHDALRTAHAKSRGYATAVPNALPCIWRGNQTMLGGRRTEWFGAIICAALFPLVSPFTRQLSLLERLMHVSFSWDTFILLPFFLLRLSSVTATQRP
ncbi:hypothetical protein BDV30DRAFT_213104 [Aspergillus minisclerotigenes]|uniref:Uncharacterized protein n=1 Tax=Aspergillus minisclerotigenes TaxID=656917 RepID=A0A5N6IZP9_9EURO|nr:hypothetical protein BDV30DRAFT_213104 [Aspergillus minisclerotigenes]